MIDLSITRIRKISEKYDVTIEIKFGSKIRAIVENDNETILIEENFDVNLIEAIEKTSKQLWEYKKITLKEMDERLNNLDPNIFPDNLFKEEK